MFLFSLLPILQIEAAFYCTLVISLLCYAHLSHLPEKSVPQAQHSFLFTEVSETVHMYTLMRSLKDCPIPSAAFVKNQKHMKYYCPVPLSTYTKDFRCWLGFSPDMVPSSLLSTDASCSLSVLALPAFYTHSLFSYILDLQWKSWSISSRSIKWLQQKKMVQEENQNLWFSLPNVLFYLCFLSFSPYI